MLAVVNGHEVTINNLVPRLDVHGEIMDAHDGSITRYTIGNSTLYYYHGMQYGLCLEPAHYGCDRTVDNCGFQFDHNISIWTSPDLSSGSWTFVGNAIDVDSRPPGVVYRPHLVYNPSTKLYVLVWNFDYGANALLAAATAPSPAGPFTLATATINLFQGGHTTGDFTLFVDDDGTGYIVYSANWVMHIEQLSSTYYGNTTVYGGNFTEFFVEAPAMFKRNGLYYVLFGYCCCYCEQGSGVMVHVSKYPMGPYQKISGDLACKPITGNDTSQVGDGIPTPNQGCQYANTIFTSVARSQQNYVIEVATSNGTEYIWTGDRWQQAPDGIKGHDPQYWVPLQFTSDGLIANMTWVDEFTIDVL
jgi:beta-xylosidase